MVVGRKQGLRERKMEPVVVSWAYLVIWLPGPRQNHPCEFTGIPTEARDIIILKSIIRGREDWASWLCDLGQSFRKKDLHFNCILILLIILSLNLFCKWGMMGKWSTLSNIREGGTMHLEAQAHKRGLQHIPVTWPCTWMPWDSPGHSRAQKWFEIGCSKDSIRNSRGERKGSRRGGAGALNGKAATSPSREPIHPWSRFLGCLHKC